MKLIGVLQGVSAYREIMEEYAPERQVPLSDLVQGIRAAYQFQQFPMFVPTMVMPAGTLNFNNGRYSQGDSPFAINQLVMTPKGDSVATSNTDQSDVVLESLLELLDTKFGYRLRQSSKTKIYWSHVVVEFDKGLEEYIEKISAIEKVISARAGRDNPYRFKGASFGTTTSRIPANADTIDVLQAQDFIIERRVDHPFEQNRFFSSAPLNTNAHIAALEEIENALRN